MRYPTRRSRTFTRRFRSSSRAMEARMFRVVLSGGFRFVVFALDTDNLP